MDNKIEPIATHVCDDCDAHFTGPVRGVFSRRPSDPTELVATLWICGACAARVGAPPREQELPADWRSGVATYNQVETYGQYLLNGEAVMFVS